jgi:signal peptidase I
LIEPFNIPSESMVPTLQTGDFILVNKFAYGVRLPIINTKVIDVAAPKQGDVVVFRYPLNPTTNYIKRVVGVPNDTVAYKEGALTINGLPIARQHLAAMGDSSYERFYREGLGQHGHVIRELNDVYSASQAPFVNTQDRGRFMGRAGREWEVKVPAGHYFVMGDNRDQCADSRWWGFVPERNLSGRAFYVWMHKPQGLHLPTFSRNGTIH